MLLFYKNYVTSVVDFTKFPFISTQLTNAVTVEILNKTLSLPQNYFPMDTEQKKNRTSKNIDFEEKKHGVD